MRTWNEIKAWLKRLIQIEFKMIITWSKVVGAGVIVLGFVLSYVHKDNTVWYTTLPFGTFLITGRWIKEVKSENNNLKASIEKEKLNNGNAK